MGHCLFMRKGETHKAPISGILASDIAVGSSVYLMENGVATEYLVVNQGVPSGSSLYDASCDGTWLLRKDIIENRVWASRNVNKLENSDIQSWLNSTMLAKYEANIQNAIKQVKIPYRKNGGSGGSNQSGANGLSCKVFLLSGREVGFTTSDNINFPNDGAKLDYFESGDTRDGTNRKKRIAYLNGTATDWWLRSPRIDVTNYTWFVNTNGARSSVGCSSSCGVRPALVIPSTALLDEETMLFSGKIA